MALDAVDKLSDDDGQPVAKPKPPPKGKSKAKVSPKKKTKESPEKSAEPKPKPSPKKRLWNDLQRRPRPVWVSRPSRSLPKVVAKVVEKVVERALTILAHPSRDTPMVSTASSSSKRKLSEYLNCVSVDSFPTHLVCWEIRDDVISVDSHFQCIKVKPHPDICEDDLEGIAAAWHRCCHSVFLSFCVSVILCFCHSVILSFCDSVILWFCHSVMLSSCFRLLCGMSWSEPKGMWQLPKPSMNLVRTVNPSFGTIFQDPVFTWQSFLHLSNFWPLFNFVSKSFIV